MSEQVQTQAEEVKETAPGAEAPATPDLTISDLQAMKTIIDVACARGTFRANEMASVGNVFNRLTSFLDHVAPQAKEGAAAEAPKQ